MITVSWNFAKQHSDPHAASSLLFSNSLRLVEASVARAAKELDRPSHEKNLNGLQLVASFSIFSYVVLTQSKQYESV